MRIFIGRLDSRLIYYVWEWDGYRPPIKELLYDFRRFLIQKKIDDYYYKQKNEEIKDNVISHYILVGLFQFLV